MARLKRLRGYGDKVDEVFTFASVSHSCDMSMETKIFFWTTHSASLLQTIAYIQIINKLVFQLLTIIFLSYLYNRDAHSSELQVSWGVSANEKHTNQRGKNGIRYFSAKFNTTQKLSNNTTHPRHWGQSPKMRTHVAVWHESPNSVNSRDRMTLWTGRFKRRTASHARRCHNTTFVTSLR